MVTCIVCQTSDGIYKCPTCRQSYCSVKCCKLHKETQCKDNIKPTEEEIPDETKNEQYNYVTEDTVPLNALQKLGESTELKDLLRVPDLRKILIAIDNSKTHNKDIQKALLDPLFSKFVDTCLSIVEPSDDTEIPEDIKKLRDSLKEF